MTAIQAMKIEIGRMHKEQLNCINNYGIMKRGHGARYCILAQKIQSFKESIEFLESLRTKKEREDDAAI